MIDWNRLQHYQQAMSLWNWGIAVTVILSAIWFIFWLRSRFREDAEDTDQTMEMLSGFRDLHHEGGLSDDEFRLIRSRLAHSAQEAHLNGTVPKSNVQSDSVSAKSAGTTYDDSTETPATDATAKDDSKSAGMTDEVTD